VLWRGAASAAQILLIEGFSSGAERNDPRSRKSRELRPGRFHPGIAKVGGVSCKLKAVTLLLNLLGQSGIHTSSDYRLTDVRTQRTIEDMAGSKQFRVTRPTWSADVSFTGIAQVGGWKTRDWIAQVLSGTPNSSEVAVVVADLARAGTKELLALPRNLRQLTIVLAVTEKRKPSRLFVISSFDRPGWPPLGNTLEHLAA